MHYEVAKWFDLFNDALIWQSSSFLCLVLANFQLIQYNRPYPWISHWMIMSLRDSLVKEIIMVRTWSYAHSILETATFMPTSDTVSSLHNQCPRLVFVVPLVGCFLLLCLHKSTCFWDAPFFLCIYLSWVFFFSALIIFHCAEIGKDSGSGYLSVCSSDVASLCYCQHFLLVIFGFSPCGLINGAVN